MAPGYLRLEPVSVLQKLTPQQLQELKNYDAQKQDLDRKLKENQNELEKARSQRQPQPLLKSG